MGSIRHDRPLKGHPSMGDPAPGRANIKQWVDPHWRDDIRRLISRYGAVRTRNHKQSTGLKTATNRRHALERTMSLLTQKNPGIKTLSQLTPRHASDVISCWAAEHVSESTQVQYFSVLRWFWAIHGIVAGSIKEYVIDPQAYVIRKSAQFDKSVTAHAADPNEVFRLLEEQDVRMRLYAQLAYSAGLRRMECLCLDPHANDLGTKINIVRGAKGGRPRVVDLTAAGRQKFELARAALDELKQITRVGEKAGWPGLSLKQAERRFEYLCDKAGVTKKSLGATFHGFRHDYAIGALELLTGQKAPVRGGMIMDYERLRQHQLQISQQLGHNRPQITAAYYGSFRSMARTAQNNFVHNWKVLQPHLDLVRDILQAYDVTNLFFAGARAMGVAVQAAAPFDLRLPFGVEEHMAVEVSRVLTNALTSAIGMPVTVTADQFDNPTAREQFMKYAFPLFTPSELDVGPEAGAPAADHDLNVNTNLQPAGPKPDERNYRRASYAQDMDITWTVLDQYDGR